jgi:molybdopterin synthase catalytic subunit
MAACVIHLTHESIDSEQALRQVQTTQTGAVVMFLGTTREFTQGRQTTRLEYESYREMAERTLADLEQRARARWPIVGCALIHRLGRVDLGEASVLVAVSTPHRREAFEAAAWLMDAIKQEVPIWKQEHWADGSCDWVHPGSSQASRSHAMPRGDRASRDPQDV